MITGNACINYLSDKQQSKDKASSSYWNKYHEGFQFDGKKFDGLKLLGHYQKTSKPSLKKVIKAIQDKLFQLPYYSFSYNKRKFMELNKITKKIASLSGQSNSLERLRHTLTMDFLLKSLDGNLTKHSKVCVIGDGFSTMSSLLIASKSAGQVFLINLNKSLLVDIFFLKKIYSNSQFENSVCLVSDKEGLLKASNSKYKFVAITASNYNLLQYCPINLAINIASMQEMGLQTIKKYFDYLRLNATQREIFFYCCNREEKVLPDGQVIKFLDYPWSHSDDILTDELCPWHQFIIILLRLFIIVIMAPLDIDWSEYLVKNKLLK